MNTYGITLASMELPTLQRLFSPPRGRGEPPLDEPGLMVIEAECLTNSFKPNPHRIVKFRPGRAQPFRFDARVPGLQIP